MRITRILRSHSAFAPGLEILVVAAALSSAQAGTITDLGTLGGPASAAYAINSSGQIVGGSRAIGSNVDHPFVYSGGVMTDLYALGGTAYGINSAGQVVGNYQTGSGAFLDTGIAPTDLGTLGGSRSEAAAINNAGQIAGGSFQPGNTFEHAFLYSGGKMIDLGTLGGTLSEATGINSAGAVVGYSYLAVYSGGNAIVHAFLYSGGSMTDVGTLSGSLSVAEGINDEGQIVGVSSISAGSSVQHAFLYSGGTMTDLGTLTGFSDGSIAYGINNAGEVVGASTTADGSSHAFVYDNGIMIDLNSLLPANSGWELSGARGINDLGQIVGSGTIGGQVRAFLLDTWPCHGTSSFRKALVVPLTCRDPACNIAIGGPR
jgi:probable HAF family extracellular repeat protein